MWSGWSVTAELSSDGSAIVMDPSTLAAPHRTGQSGRVVDALTAVYVRPNGFYLTSSDRTTAGLWMETGNWDLVTTGLPTDIGVAVLRHLESSRLDVRHPGRHDFTVLRAERVKPLLRLAGVRTWRAFVISAILIQVERRDAIHVISMKRDGRKIDGFTQIAGADIRLDKPSPYELGVAVVEAERVAREHDRR